MGTSPASASQSATQVAGSSLGQFSGAVAAQPFWQSAVTFTEPPSSSSSPPQPPRAELANKATTTAPIH